MMKRAIFLLSCLSLSGVAAEALTFINKSGKDARATVTRVKVVFPVKKGETKNAAPEFPEKIFKVTWTLRGEKEGSKDAKEVDCPIVPRSDLTSKSKKTISLSKDGKKCTIE